jgi:hypothetical protein
MSSKDGKDLPEGMMWDALNNNKIVTIESVEQASRLRMER